MDNAFHRELENTASQFTPKKENISISRFIIVTIVVVTLLMMLTNALKAHIYRAKRCNFVAQNITLMIFVLILAFIWECIAEKMILPFMLGQLSLIQTPLLMYLTYRRLTALVNRDDYEFH